MFVKYIGTNIKPKQKINQSLSDKIRVNYKTVLFNEKTWNAILNQKSKSVSLFHFIFIY